jgi:hypothetical protein
VLRNKTIGHQGLEVQVVTLTVTLKQTHYLSDFHHLASLIGLAKEPLQGPGKRKKEIEQRSPLSVHSSRHVEIGLGL